MPFVRLHDCLVNNITKDPVTGLPLWEGNSWPGGGAATSIDWTNIFNKPSTFSPSYHTHDWTHITNLPEKIIKITIDNDGKPLWDGNPWPCDDCDHECDWNEIINKPNYLSLINVDLEGNPTWGGVPWPSDCICDWNELINIPQHIQKIDQDSSGNPLWDGQPWPGGEASPTNIDWTEIINKPITNPWPCDCEPSWENIKDIPEALTKIQIDIITGKPLWDGIPWVGLGNKIHFDVINPEDTLGIDSDMFVNTDTWGVWYKELGSWEFKGTLKGADGSDGENGNTILTGLVDPISEGNNGDYYINQDSWHIWYNESGLWVDKGSIKGTGEEHECDWNEMINIPNALKKIGDDGLNNPTWDGGPWPSSGNKIYFDNIDPTNSLGVNSDMFVNTDTWGVWYKELGSWEFKGTLKGADGSDGSDGENGNTILTGLVDPISEGNNGDYYINQDSWHIWYKISGLWVDKGSIKGADGSGEEHVCDWDEMINIPDALKKIDQDIDGKPTWDGGPWPSVVQEESPYFSIPKLYTFYLERDTLDDRLKPVHDLPPGWTFDIGTGRTNFVIRHNENKLVALFTYSFGIPDFITSPNNKVGMGYATLYTPVSGQPTIENIPDGVGLTYDNADYNSFQISGMSSDKYVISFMLVNKIPIN